MPSDPERLVRLEENQRHTDEGLDELKNDLFAGETGRIHLLERRVTELEKTLWRILGALALGILLINVLMAFWKK